MSMLDVVRFATRKDAQKVAVILSLTASVNSTIEQSQCLGYEIKITIHGNYYPANFASISAAIAEAGVTPLNRP